MSVFLVSVFTLLAVAETFSGVMPFQQDKKAKKKLKHAPSEIAWPTVPQCRCWSGLLFLSAVEHRS